MVISVFAVVVVVVVGGGLAVEGIFFASNLDIGTAKCRDQFA